jgi:hypothetical protein
MATVGEWGKMERRLRGIDPRAHLVLGLLAEAASQVGRTGGGGARGRRRSGVQEGGELGRGGAG